MKIEIIYCDLLKIIKMAKGFVSKSEKKPILKGVKLETTAEGTIRLYATDSYKAIIQENIANIIEEGSCIFDPLQIEKLLTAFPSMYCMVKLETQENKLIISYEEYLFKIRLLEGNYPSLMNVFPKDENLNESVGFDICALKNVINSLGQVSGGLKIRLNKAKNGAALFEPVSQTCGNTKTILLPWRID